jgi:hypothetical protein
MYHEPHLSSICLSTCSAFLYYFPWTLGALNVCLAISTSVLTQPQSLSANICTLITQFLRIGTLGRIYLGVWLQTHHRLHSSVNWAAVSSEDSTGKQLHLSSLMQLVTKITFLKDSLSEASSSLATEWKTLLVPQQLAHSIRENMQKGQRENANKTERYMQFQGLSDCWWTFWI